MNLIDFFILVVAIVFNASANILLKFGMQKTQQMSDVGLKGMLLNSITNVYVWLGLISFGVAFIFYSVVLTKMKLGIAYPIMTSAGFVIVTLFAVFLFDEKMSWLKIAGIAIIALGIWLISIAK
ncbi:Small multidrug resistance protein [Mesotoga infera]|uniref:Small multidrug resistance protein n=1 Tax=Mesotoga infera TaxID=1236046 RepID=A0A7Z7LGU4_9BACT|nr:SMR family transporter [Mesotoga infera]SSC13505.1 Small multidrug resistance protein [Mesotoga infera]HON26853.1 SMR family transporter [Mesotoga infera]